MKIFNCLTKPKGKGKIFLLCLPCHTQTVEWVIKTVTEVSSTYYINKSDKESFIEAQIESQSVIPKFDSKKNSVTI